MVNCVCALVVVTFCFDLVVVKAESLQPSSSHVGDKDVCMLEQFDHCSNTCICLRVIIFNVFGERDRVRVWVRLSLAFLCYCSSTLISLILF